MNLYFSHTPIAVWNILSLLRFAISRTTTMRLYDQAMTIPVHTRLNWTEHPTTAIIGADNMHYITYVHVPFKDNETGKVRYTHVYNTINIWQLYPTFNIANYDEPSRKKLPDINERNLDRVVNELTFNWAQFTQTVGNSWTHTKTIKNANLPFSEYPQTTHRVATPNIEIHQPLHDVDTATYAHVEKLLDWIWENLVHTQHYKLVMLFGDEQLVCRVWHLLEIRGEIWGEILPFPGELHFLMHFCLGLMRIGGDDYLLPLANYLGYTYAKKDFALRYWSQHDDLMMLLAEGMVSWLQSKLPANMQNATWAQVLKKVQPNQHISLYNYLLLFSIFLFDIIISIQLCDNDRFDVYVRGTSVCSTQQRLTNSQQNLATFLRIISSNQQN